MPEKMKNISNIFILSKMTCEGYRLKSFHDFSDMFSLSQQQDENNKGLKC